MAGGAGKTPRSPQVLLTLNLIRLAAIVDSVNTYDLRGVKIEKHTPFANPETVEPLPVGKHFGIALSGFSLARERSQNSHGSIAVKPAKIGAGSRFPNESLLHESKVLVR